MLSTRWPTVNELSGIFVDFFLSTYFFSGALKKFAVLWFPTLCLMGFVCKCVCVFWRFFFAFSFFLNLLPSLF